MEYYNSFTKNNLTYSCDMLRLKFSVKKNEIDLIGRDFYILANSKQHYDYQHYFSTAWFNYKDLYSFKYENSVVSVGLGFNGTPNQLLNCFIEFNPNKTMSNGYALPILSILKKYVYGLNEFEIARFDFAIDLPFKRDFVYLAKDRRNYQQKYHLLSSSSSFGSMTEYLGQRNSHGYIKVYNKTTESNLSYDLTRVEITCEDFDFDNFKKIIPKVYFFNYDCVNYLDSLSETDIVFLRLLANSDNPLLYCNMLGRDKKDKFKKLLFSQIDLQIDSDIFYKLVCNIKKIYNF